MKEISPQLFGPGTWATIHFLAISCDEGKIDTQCVLKVIERVLKHLPCRQCRKHSSDYYAQNPPAMMAEKNGLFRWSWEFHNTVNRRLGKRVIPYEEARKMYENMEVLVASDDCSSCDDDHDNNQEVNIYVKKQG
jgi:hypothetical protein